MELINRRRAMMGAKTKPFTPYLITTPYKFYANEVGVWYLTLVDKGTLDSSSPIRVGANGEYPNVVAANMAAYRNIRITINADGSAEFYSPAINQYYGEITKNYNNVNTLLIYPGWGGATATYRIDIDVEKWGIK